MSLSVLVIEDEAVVAIDLEIALEEMGHRVVGAGTLEEGERAVEAHDFDLAILDVNLNGELSYPLAAALEAKSVPIVFLTGYGADGLEPEWRTRPVLQKPMKREALARLVQQTKPRAMRSAAAD